MRRFLPALLLLLGLTPLALAQQGVDPTRIYSNPDPPSSDVLERLHMKQAWRAYIPMDSKRDGIHSIQFAPYIRDKKEGIHLLVQNRSGFVVCLDYLTGQVVWKTLIGKPYSVVQPLAFNNRGVVAIRGTDIFALDRDDGRVRWETRTSLTSTLETAPIMDSQHLFATRSSDNKILAFKLPSVDEKEPRLDWDYRPFLPVDLPPQMTENFLVVPSSKGSVQVMFKDVARPYIRFRTEGKLRTTVGIHAKDGFIYIGSSDNNVYAEKVEDGSTQRTWRYTTGTPVTRTPMVNDRDVYAVAERNGGFRLLRKDLDATELGKLLVILGYITDEKFKTTQAELGPKGKDPRAILDSIQKQNFMTQRQRNNLVWQGGDMVWQNKHVDRVVAVNSKFVYALDSSGRLLVLSHATGKELSRWDDARDFPFPIVNEVTDRLFFAAHNGLIVCLYDTDYPTPQTMKTELPIAVVTPPKKVPPKDPPKDPPPMGGGMVP